MLNTLHIRNFRNYAELNLENLAMLTILVGKNGAGKTNFIEAIQMLCAGSSFRKAKLSEMIALSEPEKTKELLGLTEPSAKIEGILIEKDHTIDLSVVIQNATRRYRVNDNNRSPSFVRDLVSTVTFTPDDMALVKGSMSQRRNALDSLGSRLSANYSKVVTDYNKVISHKNALLKERASKAMLNAINDLVIPCGAQLTCLRLRLLECFAPMVIERYRAISQGSESLSLGFTPSWLLRDKQPAMEWRFSPQNSQEVLSRDEARQQLKESIEALSDEELRRARTLVGPQADRIEFYVDGQPAQSYASQGQQRTLVLAYKLGEAQTIELLKGKKPLLLLDDVMSELDSQRKEALIDYLKSGAQTFITTTHYDGLDVALLDEARVVRIDHGAVV